jgi:hypothetical protein
MKPGGAVAAAALAGLLVTPSLAAAQIRGVIRGSGVFNPTVAVAGGGIAIGPGLVLLEPYAGVGAGAHGAAVLGGFDVSLRIVRTSDRTWLYVGVGTDAALTRRTTRSGAGWQVGGNILGLAGLRNENGFFGQVAVGPPGSFANPVVVLSVGKIFGR